MVTDGFTGNIVLKTSEGVAAAIIGHHEARDDGSTRWASWARSLLRGAFARLKQTLDVDEHGGAPLVGVDGVAVLTHGAARTPRPSRTAFAWRPSFVRGGLPEAVAQAIAKHAPLWSDGAVAGRRAA